MFNGIGERIKERRIKQGFTQDDVAKELGLNRVSYSHYELNKNVPPSDKLSVLVDILRTTADYLLGKTDDPSPLPRQTYMDLSTGKIGLMTSEETAQYMADINVLSQIHALEKNIELVENIDALEYLEKKRIVDGIYSALEIIKSGQKNIPLVGTICAGDGLLAYQNIEDHVFYPLKGSKKNPDFALHVKGESMVGAGIEDGDIVFLKQSPWAEYNGQIVAAIINGEDGTLKRMKWTEGSPKIQLLPENDMFEPIEVWPNEVQICGVYVGHFKPEKLK
jgi:SOS-response transcriptional repressor LexA/DNA-binding XRE family transcriptional regulator